MTDHKTPLKFHNQVEKKFNPVAPPPQYKWDKNVIDILLILGSVESSNPQKEYEMLYTIEAHSQTEYIRACAVQLMHIVSKIEGCAV